MPILPYNKRSKMNEQNSKMMKLSHIHENSRLKQNKMITNINDKQYNNCTSSDLHNYDGTSTMTTPVNNSNKNIIINNNNSLLSVIPRGS